MLELAMRYRISSGVMMCLLLVCLIALNGCDKERPAIEPPAQFTPKPTRAMSSFQDSPQRPPTKMSSGTERGPDAIPSKSAESLPIDASAQAGPLKGSDIGHSKLTSKSKPSKPVESGR
jgi:hypothetical protein